MYAPYGVGKTRLIGSSMLVPEMRDGLLVDCEAGELTIATVDEKEYVAARESLDVVRVSNFKQLGRVHEFLKLHCRYRDEGTPEADAKLVELEKKLFPERHKDGDKPPRKYYTVMLDSLTEAETFSMYELLGVTDRTRIDEELNAAEWTEFKKNHTAVMRLVRAFRDLPMHVMMTVAAEEPREKMPKYTPMLTGKLARQVQGFMDIVGFMTIVVEGTGDDKKEIRRMFVRPGPRWDAKCRFSMYKGAYFDDPTIKSILEKVGLLGKIGNN